MTVELQSVELTLQSVQQNKLLLMFFFNSVFILYSHLQIPFSKTDFKTAIHSYNCLNVAADQYHKAVSAKVIV